MEEFFSSTGGVEESRFFRLGRSLSEILQTLPENVQIFSVGNAGQHGEKALDVWFAAHGSPYYKAEKLHGYVAANKAKVRTGSKATVTNTTTTTQQGGIDKIFKMLCRI